MIPATFIPAIAVIVFWIGYYVGLGKQSDDFIGRMTAQAMSTLLALILLVVTTLIYLTK